MSKARITALGSATFDAFLVGEALRAKRDVRTYDYVEQFPLGAKLELDDVVFGTGGGAANAAVTFVRQGLQTYFMGKIGDDLAGREVLRSLRNEGINVNLVACDLEGTTGYSTILLAPGGERTILVYRGVSEEMTPADFTWSKLGGDWLYITSLGGRIDLLRRAISEAAKKGLKVALDPGSKELEKSQKWIDLLPKVTLIKGNQQEMERLFGEGTSEEVCARANKRCQFAVVTNGPKGATASDGKQIYELGVYREVKVADRTGAGDAFGSGVVAYLAQGFSLNQALDFGAANATSVVSQIGSKDGILKAGFKLGPTRTKVKALLKA